MSKDSSEPAIWHTPLLILAGLTALAGVAAGIAVWWDAVPEAAGSAVQWGLAGASLTFTGARIVHTKRITRRELELLVLGASVVVSQYFMVVAAALIVLSLLGLAFG